MTFTHSTPDTIGSSALIIRLNIGIVGIGGDQLVERQFGQYLFSLIRIYIRDTHGIAQTQGVGKFVPTVAVTLINDILLIETIVRRCCLEIGGCRLQVVEDSVVYVFLRIIFRTENHASAVHHVTGGKSFRIRHISEEIGSDRCVICFQDLACFYIDLIFCLLFCRKVGIHLIYFGQRTHTCYVIVFPTGLIILNILIEVDTVFSSLACSGLDIVSDQSEVVIPGIGIVYFNCFLGTFGKKVSNLGRCKPIGIVVLLIQFAFAGGECDGSA